MTTQAHIIFKKDEETYPEMLWINHDAFPEVIHKKLGNVFWDNTDIEKLFKSVVESLDCENLGNFFTIDPTLNQDMNYKYFIEIRGDEIYLRTQEEYWIEQNENNNVPMNYLGCEMRTIDVKQLKRRD